MQQFRDRDISGMCPTYGYTLMKESHVSILTRLRKISSENVPQVDAATSTKHAKSFTEKFSITALENDSLSKSKCKPDLLIDEAVYELAEYVHCRAAEKRNCFSDLNVHALSAYLS